MVRGGGGGDRVRRREGFGTVDEPGVLRRVGVIFLGERPHLGDAARGYGVPADGIVPGRVRADASVVGGCVGSREVAALAGAASQARDLRRVDDDVIGVCRGVGVGSGWERAVLWERAVGRSLALEYVEVILLALQERGVAVDLLACDETEGGGRSGSSGSAHCPRIFLRI